MRRVGVILLAALASGALCAGVFALRGSGVSRWVRDPRKVVKPAPLVPVHEAVQELADCDSCHALNAPIPSAKCLACHERIALRRREKRGYHGRELLGVCHDCHVDHEDELIVFDRRAFNHEQALFPLRGAHTEVPCTECHLRPTGIRAQPTRMQYIGLDFEACDACHDDPHARDLTQNGRNCRSCHHEDGWTGRSLRFVHDRDASFRLDGRHADVECAACHVPQDDGARIADANWSLSRRTCAGCHADPHARQFDDTTCDTCHVEAGFTGSDLRFRHTSVESFRLAGAHVAVECTECHVQNAALGARRFRGTPTTCIGCHEDPHAGQFGEEACTTCHQERAFRGDALLLDHRSLEAFPLGGQHVSVSCAQCHTSSDDAPTAFRGTSHDCATCHADPHAGQFVGTDCSTCHRDSGFTGTDLAFRHQDLARFPLRGAHAAVECAACHTLPAEGATRAFRGGGTACDSCHESPHQGSLAEQACTTCHAPAGWKGTNLLFDHGRDTNFPLDTTHASQPCAACHAVPAFLPRPTECAQCHDTVADALVGSVRIEDSRENFESSPHAGLVACSQCHAPDDRTASVTDIAPRCAVCHTARYAKLELDRKALLDGLHLRGVTALEQQPQADAEPTRARLDGLRRAASHNFAPAQRALRRLVEALER